MVAPRIIASNEFPMASHTLYSLLADFVQKMPEGKKATNITGLALDSRKVMPGDCFFAYKGSSHNGRDYIQEAIEKGAVVVCYDPEEGDLDTLSLTPVPLIPIARLAHQVGFIAARFYGDPTQDVLVIGVTGTNGKTSVTHCLAHALAALGCQCAVFGTMGNGFLNDLKPVRLTTVDPITLQQQCREYRDKGAQGFILEVSSHALHQGRVAGVHFSHGVITNLTRDHLDYHGTMENYGEAKKQLFFQPGLQYAIINGDDAFGRQLLLDLPPSVKPIVFTLGKEDGPYPVVRGVDINSSTSHTSGQVQSPWGQGTLQTQLLGTFNVSNCLAVISVLGTLGYAWHAILNKVNQLPPIEGRMARYGGGASPTVIIDFAHTPDALWQVLSTLRLYCHGKLWVVFGCGGERDVGKRCEMGRVAQRWCDYIVLTNDNPRNEEAEVIVQDILQGIVTGETPTKVILDRAAAIQQTIAQADASDWILVAGKGHENYQIVGNKRVIFSDQDVVCHCLATEY